VEVAGAADDAEIRVSGTRGSVALRLTGGILRVTIEQEPPGDYLVDSFRQAVARGVAKPGTPTLVDVTRFNGVVDWAALVTVRGLAPWGETKGSPVAYVGLDSMLGMLVKIAATLFPASRHRLFANEIEALDWLRTLPRGDCIATGAA